MKLDYTVKKSITLLTVLFLIAALIISTNVSADLVISPEDGVAFDLFEDDNDILLDNCSFSEGSITLKYEPINVTYNHKEKSDSILAWRMEDTLISPGEGDFIHLLSKFINPNLIPGYEFDKTEYKQIDYKNDDETVLTHSVWWRYLNYTSYPMNLFRFTIDEDIDLINNFWVGWQSGSYQEDANVKEITMYIWSYGEILPRWDYIHSMPYNKESIDYPRGHLGENVSGNKYISNEGKVDVLIVGTPTPGTGKVHRSKLLSDYVEVKISIAAGYHPDGFVISNPIEPQSTKFRGWESIFWEGSKPSSSTYVKIQVLDGDSNLIESLEGNSQGFTNSPIDLSSLGTSYSKIRLKALLHSEGPQYTSRLYSWGVLWHTIDGFYDSFTYTFRVGERFGVDVKDGNVTISHFYSEWPIFGKNPANTRSYIAPGPKKDSNQTYWTTEIDTNFGGWFRSPVMSNGRIYIASNDKRIRAFNLISDSIEGLQYPVKVSGANYSVESSVAVGDGLVIVATSELNSKSNKIYALNTTNLSQVVWSHNPDTSICFSSSPTIANGKVFVTSWSGKFGNVPQFYYIYSWLNTILNNALGLNNKLYALDLKTGELISGFPVDLPAGSLSTPAVDDGLVFVGCENMQGSSLFAFDENSGKQIWNASVGVIGRSSSVVTEGDTEKVVIVQSRKQSLLSFSGEDKVFALRAETGEMIWNKTIGNESALLRNILLMGLDFKNLVGTSASAATPAAFSNTVYVMSPNGTLLALNVETGEEKWTFDVSQGIRGIISSYHCASPAVAGNTVYIGSQNGHVYAIDADSGELTIEYPIEFEGIKIPLILYIYSSPIVTDGLVVVSATELLPIGSANLGHLLCLGKYTNNSIGKIYSSPIHVQTGKWWNKFVAQTTITEDNRISFSILDGDGNILKSGLNGTGTDGTGNDISNSNIFNTGIIQLCADLSIDNDSQNPPVLESWKITFSIEENEPKFNEDTFYPDPGGWINSSKPVCSIKVYDVHPGLDVSSAKYRLIYKNDEKSDWYNAECTGKNGTKTNQTVTADVTKIDTTNELKRIEISIQDLSGNKAIFELSEDFKLDILAPSSFIETNLLTHYNEPVRIKANATDPGENQSGVKTIALYYRSEGEENWTQYGLSQSPFEWDFDNDISGVYEFCTIATDIAGNMEEFPDEIEDYFVFDKHKPFKPEFEEVYKFSKLPEFSIEFEDDHLLKDVEYRISSLGEWIKINDEDINNKIYQGEWTLKESDWDYMEDEQPYYLFFRISDVTGNQYETLKNDDALLIIKDTIPPGIEIDLDLTDFEGGGWKDTFTISATIPDDDDIEYVILEFRYSPDNDKWSNWKQYGKKLISPNHEWEFWAEKGSGFYEFKVIVEDEVGNFAESLPEKVSITLFPTIQLIIMIVLFVFFIGITRYIIKKMKKKK